jgi:rRNA maturation endonuclease Nob1
MVQRFPKTVRAATVKCVGCIAPTVHTVADDYICVTCGGAVLTDAVHMSHIGGGSDG